MTYEETAKEIIDRLFCEDCKLDCYEGDKCCWVTIKDALEKQIPKKPKYHEWNEVYGCPCCDYRIVYDVSKFCIHCGQAIDWSKE